MVIHKINFFFTQLSNFVLLLPFCHVQWKLPQFGFEGNDSKNPQKKKKICSPNQIFEPLFNLQLSWTMNPFSSSKILPLILIFCLPFLGLNKNPIFEKSALHLFLANQYASE